MAEFNLHFVHGAGVFNDELTKKSRHSSLLSGMKLQRRVKKYRPSSSVQSCTVHTQDVTPSWRCKFGFCSSSYDTV